MKSELLRLDAHVTETIALFKLNIQCVRVAAPSEHPLFLLECKMRSRSGSLGASLAFKTIV
ncbi:hypothetical protein [Chlorogloeopsis sp. ULAP02]|uniref:hypothetical protein n=1 Tax=Chlorogloeopsis sp. ULAP02 TaxID=3107926 RepID=UPI0031349A1D